MMNFMESSEKFVVRQAYIDKLEFWFKCSLEKKSIKKYFNTINELIETIITTYINRSKQQIIN